jgi:hypothetical protein
MAIAKDNQPMACRRQQPHDQRQPDLSHVGVTHTNGIMTVRTPSPTRAE